MLYIAQISCVFSRLIKLPATQENTANPGESPMNSGELSAKSRQISDEFLANFPQTPGKWNSLLHTQSPPPRTQDRGKFSQNWYNSSPCFPLQVCLLE